MEKSSWLDKTTNEEVFRSVNEDWQILNYLAKKTAMDWSCFEMMDLCMKLLKAE